MKLTIEIDGTPREWLDHPGEFAAMVTEAVAEALREAGLVGWEEARMLVAGVPHASRVQEVAVSVGADLSLPTREEEGLDALAALEAARADRPLGLVERGEVAAAIASLREGLARSEQGNAGSGWASSAFREQLAVLERWEPNTPSQPVG